MNYERSIARWQCAGRILIRCAIVLIVGFAFACLICPEVIFR